MGARLGSPEVRKYKKRLVLVFGPECYFCRNSFPLEELTLEHLIPTARGGSARSMKNHALACFECNNYKSGLTVQEYCEVKGLNPRNYGRTGELKSGVDRIGPVTNTVDLARLALLR